MATAKQNRALDKRFTGRGNGSRNGNNLRFYRCPSCDQKGLYHVRQKYSRCRYCGLYRIALPGQDF